MIKNLLIIVLLLVALSANSQLNEYFDDIKKTFEKDKQEELSGISIKIKEAQSLFVSGDLSKTEEASTIFQENYRKLFLIYEQKLEKISKEEKGEVQDYINYLLSEAKSSFKVSTSERGYAEEEKDDKILFELLKSAHQNEIEAIDFQSRAFGVINGWIKEELTIPDTNYNVNEMHDNLTDNFKAKNFSVKDASLPGNYTFKNQTQTGRNDNYLTDVANNEMVEGREFRIQIRTSVLPLKDFKTKRINSTDYEVKVYRSGGVYKYTIGSFAGFQEAKNFKNAFGLSKTYICEYNNGKEVKFYKRDVQ